MRLLFPFFFFFFSFFFSSAFFSRAVLAADGSSYSSVNTTCSAPCFTAALLKTDCSFTNQTCLCADTTFRAAVTSCVKESCSVKVGLVVRHQAAIDCKEPIRDKGAFGKWLDVGLCIFALLTVTLRVIARTPLFGQQLKADDFTIILSGLILIPFTVLSADMSDLGFGKDLWMIEFDNLTKILHYFYINEALYFTILMLTKVSLLAFYLRVFPNSLRSLWIAIWVTMGFTVASNMTIIFAGIFQCNPINLAWVGWNKDLPGHCNNTNAQGWAGAVFNMIQDIVILLLPVPHLLKLNISRRKKIHVMIMFSLGSFVTVTSMIRLGALKKFTVSDNPTWDYFFVDSWSVIEINVGIVCACLPAIRVLLTRCFSSVFPPSTVENSAHQPSNSRSTPAKSNFSSSYGNSHRKDYDSRSYINLDRLEAANDAESATGSQEEAKMASTTTYEEMRDDGSVRPIISK